MSNDLYLILALIVLGFGLMVLFINRKLGEFNQKNQTDETLTEWLKSMQLSIDNTAKTLNGALSFVSLTSLCSFS